VGFPLALPQTTEEITEARSLTTGLESCGLAAADTTAVLKELAAGRSLDELSREIATGSLLRKRSRTGRQHLLTAIRKRYLKPMAPLPDTLVLAAGLERIKAPTAQGQLLLPYLLSADRAAYEVVVGRVLPRRAAGERITTTEIVDELDRVFARFGKGSWGPRVRLRWSQGILSVLRDVGAVGRGVTREVYLAYAVRPEAFGFHLRGLYDSGIRGSALIDSPFWQMLLLNEQDARQAVRVVVERGWWRHTNVGGVEEMLPSSRSIKDWIMNELG
jgi:hypothetical protein